MAEHFGPERGHGQTYPTLEGATHASMEAVRKPGDVAEAVMDLRMVLSDIMGRADLIRDRLVQVLRPDEPLEADIQVRPGSPVPLADELCDLVEEARRIRSFLVNVYDRIDL